MALNVPLEDRVYVDSDGHGGWVYVRYRGGTEVAMTEDEVLNDQWRFFFSDAALEQLRAMFATDTKESVT